MISQQEYQLRRQRLADLLPQGSIALIAAASESLRNGDVTYPFRQSSHFYYLTGFNEPNAVLIVCAGKQAECCLFNQPNDPVQEQWTGKRLGQEDACRVLGMQSAFSVDSLEKKLPQLLSGKTAVYYPMGNFSSYEPLLFQSLQALKQQIRRGVQAPHALQDIDPLISGLRLIKSPAEIAIMRQVAAMSVDAHRAAMQACRGLQWEYQLEAEIRYALSRQGCRHMAYDTIVGSGANACILHYTQNNQRLHAGDLVLIDAGGEYENYAADITRTFPVNGRFTPEQRAIYELVLKAQQAAIACIKPGTLWNVLQDTILRVLTAGLCELGILEGDVDRLLEIQAYKPFYMHNSGHWLGLDVHDCGEYRQDKTWRPLEAGMVLTVEPGLYIQANMPQVDPRWWNIGVRIEDDILVTPQGHENLTAALPVAVKDIEALLCHA